MFLYILSSRLSYVSCVENLSWQGSRNCTSRCLNMLVRTGRMGGIGRQVRIGKCRLRACVLYNFYTILTRIKVSKCFLKRSTTLTATFAASHITVYRRIFMAITPAFSLFENLLGRFQQHFDKNLRIRTVPNLKF